MAQAAAVLPLIWEPLDGVPQALDRCLLRRIWKIMLTQIQVLVATRYTTPEAAFEGLRARNPKTMGSGHANLTWHTTCQLQQTGLPCLWLFRIIGKRDM